MATMNKRIAAQWQGRARFVVLDAGAGAVERFLALWDAWRRDPSACERLHVIAIEARGLDRSEALRSVAGTPLETLGEELADAWPPMTANLHRLAFDAARVQL